MSTEQVNYAAVLADLEARKAQIEAAIAAIKMISSQGGSPSPHGDGSHVGPSAFLGLSIPDATVKHLAAVKQKKSTQEIIDALVAGGLPPAKYATVYNILTRRQRQVGDIVNMKGDWGLAEWYPNHRFAKAAKEEEESEPVESKKIASA